MDGSSNNLKFLKQNNPLALPQEPDFVGRDGSRWWGIGEVKCYNRVYKTAMVEQPNGDKAFIIANSERVIYETLSLEQLGVELAFYKNGFLR